ncbi:Fur family transcriptional regulator [Aestuariimicrobium sp. Y1814]|uniref:Fur family transcriptional regulator n=1 Tax=Aestuariimicrobium sp. Y1814 TaxID=3418742 RepID=UPI003DA7A21F
MTTPIRQTRQRSAIRALFTGSDEFRTAQQVHSELAAAGDKVGLATVYRTLQTMADAEELDAVRSPEGEMTYRACSSGSHHHHLICRNCGKAVEIEATAVEAWAAQVAAQHGFRDAGHELEMFGLCQDC